MRRLTSRRMTLLAAALLLLFFAAIYAGSKRSSLRTLGQIHSYLSANRQSLDVSDVGAHFDASLIDTRAKRIFLLGESRSQPGRCHPGAGNVRDVGASIHALQGKAAMAAGAPIIFSSGRSRSMSHLPRCSTVQTRRWRAESLAFNQSTSALKA